MKRFTRREALKLTALAGSSVLLPIGLLRRGAASEVISDATGSPKTPPFQIPLPIMPVLSPVRRDATTDYYEITQKPAQVEILPGLKTTIWGYNGQFPGPTIKSRVGRQTVVTQFNHLPTDPFSVHLHGMASLPEYDGYPEDLTKPGQSKKYIYPNDHAATYWYHDHAMMMTAKHTYQGLAGLYIVQDDEEDRLPLPKGDYDVPLMIQDRTFNRDGSLFFTPDADTILVNGAPWPRMAVANRKYRFRILNASISTPYQLALGSGEPLIVIGTDGGLMSAPQPVMNIRIGPAERYEVVIDFSAYPIGTQVVLLNLLDTDDFGQVMRFDVVRQERDDSRIPATLRQIETIPESAAVRHRAFEFNLVDRVWSINGMRWNPNFFAATPKLGDVEVWSIYNNVATDPHLAHIHMVKFRILERNGKPPFPYEQGLKDTVFLDVHDSVKLLMRFGPNRGKYIFHCHVMDHEDHDMMTQFKVV